MKTALLMLPGRGELEYRIRSSSRAKYMRLTFSEGKGLIVTQPHGVSIQEVNQWVHSKLDWISRNFDKISARQKVSDSHQPPKLPQYIEVPLLKQTLLVHYKPNASQQISADYDGHNTLTLSGMTDNTAFCAHVLQKWMLQYSKIPLGKLLEEMAEVTGLEYNSFRIKAQRTRWGSCSNRGNINLNYKLALMPEHYSRYTVVHELCHTVEMNHSKRFWNLVGQFIPDYKAIHNEMKDATLVLPAWTNHRFGESPVNS